MDAELKSSVERPGERRVVTVRSSVSGASTLEIGLYAETKVGETVLIGYVRPADLGAVRESALAKGILRGVETAYIVVDRSYRIVDCNGVADGWAQRLLGRGLRRGDNYLDYLYPETEEETRRLLRAAFAGEPQEFSWEFDHRGTEHSLLLTFTPVAGEGKTIDYLVIAFRDLQVEMETLRAKDRFARIIEHSPLSVIMTDAEGIITYANPYSEKMTGYPRAELVGSKAEDLCLSELEPRRREEIWATVAAGATWAEDIDGKRKDGSRLRKRLFMTSVRDSEGKIDTVLAICEDITEAERKEAELRGSEARFEALFAHSSEAVYLLDEQGRILEANPRAVTQSGLKSGELAGERFPLWDAVVSRLDPAARDGSATLGGRLSTLQRSAAGREFPVDVSVSSLEQRGEWIHLVTVRDVSEWSDALQALAESEERFRSVMEASPIGIVYTDPEGTILEINGSVYQMLALPRNISLRGRSVRDTRLFPGAASRSWLERLSDCGCVEQNEITADLSLGRTVTLRIVGRAVYGVDDKPKGVLLLFEDISRQKEYEERLSAFLREKEALVHELHHRVKNNLQSIASLLRLQRDLVKDDEDRAIFEENINRIFSMSFVHQLLYQTDELHDIDLPMYLEELLTHLAASYPKATGHPRVEIDCDKPISLTIEKAVPLGLLVNELATNACKHAETGAESPTLTLSLRCVSEELEVMIWDNGIADATQTPRREPDKAGGFGSQLIPLFVDQLRGTMEALPGPGFKHRIRFPHKVAPGEAG